MRDLLFTALLLPLTAMAQPPAGYYDPAAGLTGDELRHALFGIIDDHTVIANSQLWDAFAFTDQAQDGSVWDIYSDDPGGTPAYTYQFGADQCGTYAGEGDCFNREHTFPQSWFDGALPMSTDLFHLYPTDAWVNQKRANWPYGTVGAATWTSTNGSKLGPCDYPGCSGTVFEPIDDYKGDLARGFFYMMTRYTPNVASWPCPITQGDNLAEWAEALLLDWHIQDPVSSKEVARNNAVFALQGNRNPFIDRPEWVQSIWGPTAAIAQVEGEVIRVWCVDDVLNVQRTSGRGAMTIQLLDAAGRECLHLMSSSALTTVPLHVPQGVYTAVVWNGNAPSVHRFVR